MRRWLAVFAGLALIGGTTRAQARQVGSSSAQNPAIIFTVPGPQTVTLTACNAAGCTSTTNTVMVLDPRPAVSTFSVTPAQLEQGQSLLLDASASGAPPLSYTWQVLSGSVVVATLLGADVTWPTTGAPPGTYTASLTVGNAAGTATSSATFTVVPASSTQFFTVTPCRALDTRLTSQPLVGLGLPLLIAVGGVCGVPMGARAVAANVTVVGPTAAGYVAVYPSDFAHPTVSWINFGAGATLANGGVLPLSTDGTARLAATANLLGTVHLLVDVSGYFASPGGIPPAAAELPGAARRDPIPPSLQGRKGAS
jgi:PKD repeat protein